MREREKQFALRGAQLLTVIAHDSAWVEALPGANMVRHSPYPMLVDPSATVSASYGAAFQWRRLGRLTNRQVTFVIDSEGVVRDRFAGNSKKLSCMVGGKGFDLLNVVDELEEQRRAIEGLTEQGTALRQAAETALRPINETTQDALPALVKALESEDAQVRSGAAAALNWIAQVAEPAVPRLIEALSDGDQQVRGYASHALGRMGGDHAPATAVPLVEALVTTPTPATLALRRLGPAATTALERGLSHTDPRIRIASFGLLRGVTVTFDEMHPDKPVIAVAFGDLKLSSKDLACLRGLKDLRVLQFDRVDNETAGLEHLAGLTSLEELEFRLANVDDESLRHVAGLTRLKKLKVAETQVTDAGLQHLRSLRNLQVLHLGAGSKVSAEAARSLQEALPGLEIRRGE